jgi:hypothetical protein
LSGEFTTATTHIKESGDSSASPERKNASTTLWVNRTAAGDVVKSE